MGSRRLRRIRALAVSLMLSLAASGAHAADPAVNACLASCNAARTGCVAEVATRFDADEAACAGAAEARSCVTLAKRVQRSGKKACKGSRKACKRCCKEAAGAGCVLSPELPVFAGSFALPDREVLPTALEAAGFPPGPGGRGFTVLALPDGVFFIDPDARSPVSAAGECADAMLACFAPPERNFAGCFAALATCKGKPWKSDRPACCPAACGERYQELRREGLGEGDAFAAAIWERPSCMPGLQGHEEPQP
jgi:hypothetical protein